MWNINFKNYLFVKADKNRTVLLFFHSFNSPFQQFKYYLNLTGKQQTQWPFKLFFHTFSPSILSPLPLHPCLSLSSHPSLFISLCLPRRALSPLLWAAGQGPGPWKPKQRRGECALHGGDNSVPTSKRLLTRCWLIAFPSLHSPSKPHSRQLPLSPVHLPLSQIHVPE